MNTYLLNPTVKGGGIYIREGRCMQKASSWVTIWPPVTLAVLGAIAKKFGPVRLLDGNVENMTLEEFLSDIGQFKADIVIINTGFPSIDGDMAVAKAIKEKYPHIIIISFGVYFTLLDEQALHNYPLIDIGIRGEPEETFTELLQCLQEGKNNLHAIRGIAYRNIEGVKVNEPRPLIEDLDTIPIPARDLLKNDCYRLPHNNKTYSLLNSARGCPFNCIYCIVSPYYGKKVRKHSISYIIEEIKECKDIYGIEEFLFWEEVFSLDKHFVAALCDAIIKNQLNIRWAATTRVDTLDETTLVKMKAAGCYLLGLGIESGNQEILDTAKKRQTLDDIQKAVAMCKRVKLQTMGHLIFGLPGETRQTAQTTIDFMLSLGLDYVQAYCAVPYPKTEFGTMARDKGWVVADRWSQYDFGGDSIVAMDTMTQQETTYFRKKAFRSFYFRPTYILKKVIQEFSLKQLFRLFRFFEWMNPVKRSH